MTSIELSFSSFPQLSTDDREPVNKFTALAKDSQYDKYIQPTAPSQEPEHSTKERDEERERKSTPPAFKEVAFNWSQHQVARQSFRKDGRR